MPATPTSAVAGRTERAVGSPGSGMTIWAVTVGSTRYELLLNELAGCVVSGLPAGGWRNLPAPGVAVESNRPSWDSSAGVAK